MSKQTNQANLTHSNVCSAASSRTAESSHYYEHGTDGYDSICTSATERIDEILSSEVPNTSSASTAKTIEEILTTEGFYLGLPNGNSMWPLLRHQKDQFLVVPAKEALKINDIALFRIGKKHILHRVIGFYEGGYVMRGDNCINCEYVPHQQVLGVLWGFYRRERYIEWNHKTPCNLYCRFLPCLFLINKTKEGIRKALHRMMR